MFRMILVLGCVGAAAFMAGWFTVQRDERETTIRFNREEIRADAAKAIEKGRELLNESQSQAYVPSGYGDQVAPQNGPYQVPESPMEYPPSYDGSYNGTPQYGAPGEPQQATRSPTPWQQLPVNTRSSQQY
ncbi:hypothetical protein FYK55_19785 [Roseiconus nitratireducens]|uniref:Uncharacterized protein n=1 Tax=Roseiconus nitratireducens TaxID=2605748 RepID=A0A5M6CZH5_9BACT|nr:hypothetical protein [Roseiconus nitratireducens]KAA5540638.1 hypothetical protein FYK55_19785 [Roseiconus nitratireducens]